MAERPLRKTLKAICALALLAALALLGLTASLTGAQETPLSTPRAAPFDPAAFAVGVELVAEGFERPVHVASAGDDSGRLFVVEQEGRIRIVEGGRVLAEPFLDIVELVGSRGSEQGLLSVAFDPNDATNGSFFVDYTDRDGDTRVVRYAVSIDDPNRTDPASALPILSVDQPAGNHNGGLLLFGPDGHLYVGFGDGGGGGSANGQRPDTLLGKILRLDVRAATAERPYAIPSDNPFAGDPATRPEIWVTGLRNPWRFGFDRLTGDLFIGDVGSATYEEVNYQPGNSPGGENYGWPIKEGTDCRAEAAACAEPALIDPIAQYGRDLGSVVVGGVVYRGSALPALVGTYLFADYGRGTIWGLGRDADGAWTRSAPVETDLTISSFGEDERGELYVVDLGGALYRLTGG